MTSDKDKGVAEAVAEARRRWPEVDFDAVAAEAVLAGYDGTAAPDLLLAAACTRGEPAALRALEVEIFEPLPATLAKLGVDADDAVQEVRERLLVGGKLGDYRGAGPLRAWIKVIALREGLRAARKGRREVPLSEQLEAALPDPAADPDLAYQRDLYRGHFRDAFTAALAQLSDRQRSLLRHAVLHRATSDQIAGIYGVHRATAARWVAQAREQLATLTRRELRQRLDASSSLLESLHRLVDSQLDLSVERLLDDDET